MVPNVRALPPPSLVPGEVGANALGLPEDVCLEVVDALGRDVATLLLLFHRAQKHRWTARGAESREVRRLLAEHAQGLLADADLLAERIAMLGGVPPSSPGALETLASAPPEEEGVFTLRIMLQRDLRGREQVCRDLRRDARTAEQRGDLGTAQVLREVLARQERLAHDLHRILADESLAIGLVRERFGLRDRPAPEAPPPGSR